MSKLLRSAFGFLLLSSLASAQQIFRAPPIPWAKEAGVRLNLDGLDPAGTTGLNNPFVLRLPDRSWRMYYSTSETHIASARSFDGLAWVKEGTRISAASLGVQNVGLPTVVRVGSSYRMYFRTWSPGVTFRMHSSLSSDGLNWTYEGIRLSDTGAIAIVQPPSGGYRVYFHNTQIPQNIPLPISSAFSSDGLTWTVEPGTRHPGTRSFTASVLEDGQAVLTYAADDWTTIRTARSTNGLDFTDDSSVRLTPGNHPDSALESTLIAPGCLVQFPDGKARLYYNGSHTTNLVNPGRIFSAVVTVREAAPELGGAPATSWTKEGGTRLNHDGWEPVGTTSLLRPSILRFPDGTMRAYYVAYPTSNVMSAVSADGITLTKEPGFRVTSSYFGDLIYTATVIEAGPGLYRMYAGANQAYSAVSTDGINWTGEGLRLGGVHFPSIVRMPTGYRMYHWIPNTVNVGSAFSPDGITWSHEPGIRLTNAIKHRRRGPAGWLGRHLLLRREPERGLLRALDRRPQLHGRPRLPPGPRRAGRHRRERDDGARLAGPVL